MSRISPWPLVALSAVTVLLMTASIIWPDDRLSGVTCLSISVLCGAFCWGAFRTGVAETKQGRFTREGEPFRYWSIVAFLGAFCLIFWAVGLGILTGLIPPNR